MKSARDTPRPGRSGVPLEYIGVSAFQLTGRVPPLLHIPMVMGFLSKASHVALDEARLRSEALEGRRLEDERAVAEDGTCPG